MNICMELSAARREAGLSQQALADRLSVTRETVARVEAGVGSVPLLVRMMTEIPMRLKGVAKGATVVDQFRNARLRRGWSVADVSRRCGLDPRTVIALEAGQGSVRSLSIALAALAQRAERQREMRIFWDFDRARMNAADSRFTPDPFIAAIESVFGGIGLDPCNHPLAPIRATRKIALPECGLAADWACDQVVYVNPPYSHLAVWLAKANDEWEAGRIKKLLFLMPASRLDIREFFLRASKIATTLILGERLRFGTLEKPEGAYPAPFALALLCYGCTESEIEQFRAAYPSLLLGPQEHSTLAQPKHEANKLTASRPPIAQ